MCNFQTLQTKKDYIDLEDTEPQKGKISCFIYYIATNGTFKKYEGTVFR